MAFSARIVCSTGIIFENRYRLPRERVCVFRDDFAWRVLRSSRVSRDLEKTLSRFLAGGGGFPAFEPGSRCNVFWKSGDGRTVSLALGVFMSCAFCLRERRMVSQDRADGSFSLFGFFSDVCTGWMNHYRGIIVADALHLLRGN